MVVISKSQRTNLPPGGSALPSPSQARVNIAGRIEGAGAASDRAVAKLGQTLQGIGLIAQRANDSAELSEATIKVTSDVELELTRLKQSIQDPDLYEAEAREAIEGIVSDAQTNVGFRNKQKFNVITASTMAGANKTIISERFGKIVDREKASLEGVKDANIEAMIIGGQSSSITIANVKAKTKSMFDNGILSQQQLVVEDRAYAVRVKTEEFLATYKSNPQAAVDKINSDPELLAEQKTEIIHKTASEITKWNKELTRAVKKDMDDKMIKVSEDIEAGNINSPEALRATMKTDGFGYKQRKTLTKDFADKLSGRTIEDTGTFNEYANEILEQPNRYTADEIQNFDDMSPQKRIELLNIQTRILNTPFFNNPVYKEGLNAIEEAFARNFLDKIDPNKQDRKTDARLNFLVSVTNAIEAEEKKEGKERRSLDTIILDEVFKSVKQIRESRGGGIGVRGENTRTQQQEKRLSTLLKKLQNNRITTDEMDEYQDLLKLGK